MAKPCPQNNTTAPVKSTANDFLQAKMQQYLLPLQDQLLQRIDKRLVLTFTALFKSILLLRNSKMGLLLSELGGYIAGHAHAPAGTKRLSNLLRCPNWQASLIDEFLFTRARQRVSQLLAQGKRPLFLWDDSRLEKPEIGPPKRLVHRRALFGRKQQG